jgi:hypothetical protein
MTRQVAKDASFLKELEDGVRAILDDTELSNAERLRAIETGAKLLMIRHRITGGADGDGEHFFSKGG